MGFEVALGIGSVVLAGLWFVARRFELQAGEQADRLVQGAVRALSTFEVRALTDPTVKRRHHDGRRRRRRRKKGSAGSESQ